MERYDSIVWWVCGEEVMCVCSVHSDNIRRGSHERK